MLNKRGGWKKFQKLINGEVPIRAWRVEKVSKINKRASLFIRQVRVNTAQWLLKPWEGVSWENSPIYDVFRAKVA